MKESHKVLKEAIDKVGIKQVSTQFNISTALIYKWCENPSPAVSYKEASGTVNPLDRIKTIYDITQDINIINWVCQAADGYFVENPKVSRSDTDAKVMVNMQSIIKEFSETLATISESYNDDKKISLNEAEAIRKEWEDLKRVAESFVRACESGKFK
ncbi:MAG: hypothetical protein A2Y03_10395 [Omnitrophica WOR_2 bacterium GWF2_38_59]|nr:MAG: hypothetical protein A2Y03_10395 [Omnitrophica WOR_2 bacterium GWF2_38_59]OGX50710.1 MAG: hypothetical protein A2267_08285 [Omnitrophica WOR_2 bacterium RIFOXYA12_FULL_38_10]OGX51332.1 MAG: hypothetical protein A2243_09935 [Omnitrophica WOR_2 bacterium RIFOXYA2_FULL_38_17]OGX54983.1 MAG: hypothetical protein A2447_10810 [Omnitrophica WOR_2 bacterium RIFOXYC2_FULL_38_12]OGX55733.1 MAG: hypothetical protein A2306_02625 [Omnitrophica WOR_2 bacterium RIFOXYB2_FULL_38_16]HBG61565.1 hypothet